MSRHFIIPGLAILLAAGANAEETPLCAMSSQDRLGIIQDQTWRLQASEASLHQRWQRDGGTGFRLRASHVDEFGLTHGRFTQYFNGVKVFGAEAITHMNPDGSFRNETLALQHDINVNTTPVLDKKEALAITLRYLTHKLLPSEAPYSAVPSAELVIYPRTRAVIHHFLTTKGQVPNAIEAQDMVVQHHLAYHLHVELENAQDGPIHQDFLVDAHDGALLKSWSTIQTTQALGSGQSQYSGTVQLNTEDEGGTFLLKDTTRAIRPHPVTQQMGNLVYDLAHLTTTATGTLYTDADNAWGDGQNYSGGLTTDANGQTAAVDAAYGLQVTWDLFKNVFQRNGIDGQGTATYARVHYGNSYQNAFWNSSCFCMTFGDGGSIFKVLTSLDVSAHEMSHGVCATTAQLIYEGESGGLNESNSDIFGAMAEFYAKSGAYGTQGNSIPDTGGNWTIGEEIYKTSGGFLRDMRTPSRDNMSPNAWSPTLKYLDVHHSSGPMNRAFYYLSQGAPSSGDHSAPNYLPAGMTGIGNTNAAKIWHMALTTYLTPASIYKDARDACVKAAKTLPSFVDFNGSAVTREQAVAAVQNAFAGINVGLRSDQGSDSTPPIIDSVTSSGPGAQFTFHVTATDDTAITLVECWIDGYLAASTNTGSGNLFPVTMDSRKMANGAHSLTVKAYDAAGNIGVLANQTFTLSNPLQQVIKNTGFENGLWPWIYWNIGIGVSEAGAHSGSAYVRLGNAGKAPGDEGANTSQLVQLVQIPAKGQPSASFWVKTTTTESSANAVDKLSILLVDTQASADGYLTVLQSLGQLSNLDATAGYVKKSFAIDPALRGKQCYLWMDTEENEGLATGWYIDDVLVETMNLDMNSDNTENIIDMSFMAQYFGSSISVTPTAATADLDGDGVIGEGDITMFMNNF